MKKIESHALTFMTKGTNRELRKEEFFVERVDDWMVHEYLEKLADPGFPGPASGSATGSAAATVAATAAALLEMSYKVTLKKAGGNIPIANNGLSE